MSSKSTLSNSNVTIPVVDFGRWFGSLDDRRDVAQEVVKAFKDIGFVYLKNHQISTDLVSSAFKKSAKFFELPQEDKDKLEWKDPRSNRGYVKQGREQVTESYDSDAIEDLRQTSPDLKESMEIGLETDPEFRNHWPPEANSPDFRSTMLNFYDVCHALHMEILRAVALGLGLELNHLDPYVNEAWHTLRLLHYPPTARSLLDTTKQLRAAPHSDLSDYGSITLLFQDEVGGLQLENPNSRNYIPADPIPGTIIVNAGDLLQRWTNDNLRSTMHRVLAPTGGNLSNELTPRRLSIAYFCNPNAGSIIECLPGCEGSSGPKYRPVRSEDYLVELLSATFN